MRPNQFNSPQSGIASAAVFPKLAFCEAYLDIEKRSIVVVRAHVIPARGAPVINSWCQKFQIKLLIHREERRECRIANFLSACWLISDVRTLPVRCGRKLFVPVLQLIVVATRDRKKARPVLKRAPESVQYSRSAYYIIPWELIRVRFGSSRKYYSFLPILQDSFRCLPTRKLYNKLLSCFSVTHEKFLLKPRGDYPWRSPSFVSTFCFVWTSNEPLS